MRITGISVNENPFYAPYADECWMMLASAIMESYAEKYSRQIPTTAFTQAEYSKLDKNTYRPIRLSLLRNVKDGPLRHIVNIDVIYDAFEHRRKSYKKSLGIIWEDNEYKRPV